MEDSQITRRQLDALVNVYFGVRYANKREPAEDRRAEPWGVAPRFGAHGSSMGGAARRMGEALAYEGFFPFRVSRTGRHEYPDFQTLTAKALRTLRDRWPTLPDIDARLAAREALEADEAAAAAEAEREAAAKAEQARLAARAALLARMREILADHGIADGWPDDDLIRFAYRVGDALFAKE